MPGKVESRHKTLLEEGERLFQKRQSLDQFWQEVAYQFYPEMAEFTVNRYLGDEYADHLTTSFPLIARRALGDAFAALLRPVNLGNASPGVWFSMKAEDDSQEGTEARSWLEFQTGVMRRVMYDRQSNFVRATKEGDHSFATFGQAPLSVQLNRNRDGLLYQCHHLRDVAWTEDAAGQIDFVVRKWKPSVSKVMDFFRGRTAGGVEEKLKQDPSTEIDIRHFVIAAERYERRDGKKFRTPWVSVWIDRTHDYVMEETGTFSKIYIIPRWVTIPGSQYASSPAVTAALPDARLIQSMTLTMLESGEKYADPPLIATQEAIRSDVQTFAGGMIWVDAAYDERLGDAIRPLYEQNAGQALNVAFSMRTDVRDMITRAFFLDSLSLPPADVRDMTAFEVGQRISEWIQRAMPIFEPMEFEYNGAICEETFDILLRNGAFGPMQDIPDSLKGADIKFKFESPLHESADRKKGQKFLEAKAALVQAAEVDPNVVPMLNASEALRDVLDGIGAPAEWTRSESEMEDIARAEAEANEQAALVAGAETGAAVAKDLGSAAKDFAAAEVT